MANTYVLLSSTTLASAAASITFSSIPQTYTDLELKIVGRSTRSGSTSSNYQFTLNSFTTYSYTALVGTAQPPYIANPRYTAQPAMSVGFMPAGQATANVFGSAQLYIPNYSVSSVKQLQFKSSFTDVISGSNYMGMERDAILISDTTPISSINFASGASYTFAAGSSFYLYGIKNS
jgi:hypothetical protein